MSKKQGLRFSGGDNLTGFEKIVLSKKTYLTLYYYNT